MPIMDKKLLYLCVVSFLTNPFVLVQSQNGPKHKQIQTKSQAEEGLISFVIAQMQLKSDAQLSCAILLADAPTHLFASG